MKPETRQRIRARANGPEALAVSSVFRGTKSTMRRVYQARIVAEYSYGVELWVPVFAQVWPCANDTEGVDWCRGRSGEAADALRASVAMEAT